MDKRSGWIYTADQKEADHLGFLPFCLKWLSKLFFYGIAKHSLYGFLTNQKNYTQACQRHLTKHARGEKIDKDSGFPHLVCLAINAFIVLFQEDYNEKIANNKK